MNHAAAQSARVQDYPSSLTSVLDGAQLLAVLLALAAAARRRRRRRKFTSLAQIAQPRLSRPRAVAVVATDMKLIAFAGVATHGTMCHCLLFFMFWLSNTPIFAAG